MKSIVYLAGPISFCSYKECTSWREAVDKALHPQIQCITPMRFKEKLKRKKSMPPDLGDDSSADVFLTNKAILARDFFDVSRCDLVFVNFKGAEKVSIGTITEIAWAYMLRKPVVLVMEKKNIHEHGFILAMVPFIVPSVRAGVEAVKKILLTPSEMFNIEEDE